MSYPTDRAARQARRTQIRERLIARAEQEASLVGRSMVCALGVRHASCVGATGCICECHDPRENA